MNSEYKKYALENLKTWVQDAITTSGASTQEVFDTIKEAVKEEYYIYKHHTSQCYELLALLNDTGKDRNPFGYSAFAGDNGAGGVSSSNNPLICDKDDKSEECKKSWNDFWEDSIPSWRNDDIEAVQYTEEELNAMCDKAASDEEKNKCREYNLREAEYYNKRAELDLNNQISRNDSTRLDYKEGLIYESPDGGKTVYSRKPGETERTLVKEEKINKWVLPVGVDGLTGDCFVNLPDDLLELANLKEGDEVEWVDKKDGTYILRKATKTIKMEEC